MMLWKKRGEDSDMPSLLLRTLEEIKPLVQAYGSLKNEPLPTPLVQAIKRALGELFQLHNHFTFEEFLLHLEGLEARRDDLRASLDEALKRRQELPKRRLGRKEYKEELAKVKAEISLLAGSYSLLASVTQRMRELNLKPALCDFCTCISTLQFSEKKISSPEMVRLMKEFLWMLAALSPKSNGSGWTQKLKSAVGSISPNGRSSDLRETVLMAHRARRERNVEVMEKAYHNLSRHYEASDDAKKSKIYHELFELWFALTLLKR